MQTYTIDSRLPVPTDTSPNDPSHPNAVIKAALMTRNQATADSKYDIIPPPRIIEKFVGSSGNSHFYVAILLIVLSLYTVLHVKNTAIRTGGIVILIMSIHYAVGKISKFTV